MLKINEYRSPGETKSETNGIENQKIPRVENSEKVAIFSGCETKPMREQYTNPDSPHLL
jgi:hypothetical protein